MNILQMSISAGLMIIVIIVVRSVTINRLPKKTFLVLWWLAMVRMLVPFSIPSPFSFFSLAERTRITGEIISISTVKALPNAVPQIAEYVSGHAVNTKTVSVWAVVWTCGIVLCGLLFLISYIRYCREFMGSLPVENDFTMKWLSDHSLKRHIQIRQSDRMKAPLTYGIFQPVILMPKRTDWTDIKRLQYVLQHEYVHIRRFDTVTKILLAGALCIHWFNPLVWVMFLLANRDLEISCDEAVVRSFGEPVKSAYAMTLIGMEEQKSGFVPFCNNFSKNAIEERIKAIMKMKKTSAAAVLAAITLIIGVTFVFATSAAASDKTLSAVPGTNFSQAEYDQLLALRFDNLSILSKI